MAKKYIIVSNNDKAKFEEEVSHYLSNGFRCEGDLSAKIVTNPQSGESENSKSKITEYTQAMIHDDWEEFSKGETVKKKSESSDQGIKYEITSDDIHRWKKEPKFFKPFNAQDLLDGRIVEIDLSRKSQTEQKKILLLRKNNPNLYNEIFGTSGWGINASAHKKPKVSKFEKQKRQKNKKRIDAAVMYFQTYISDYVDQGKVPNFFFTAGRRSRFMENYHDRDISLWQYTRIESEAKSFVKYHVKNNKQHELNRICNLDFYSRDPALIEIREYLQKIL